MADSFSSALVIDDDAPFLRNLARALRLRGFKDVRTAETVEAAVAALDEPVDCVLCDLCLAGQDGLAVIKAAQALEPRPAVVAMSGRASRGQVFGLMEHGVSAFLEKPFETAELRACLERAADASRVLREVARNHVGRVGAREAQAVVKATMFREALAITGGNRRAAARLLKVDRRLVQLMAQENDN